jgi:hypothetical protein
MSGSLQLREYPREIVRLSCPKCGRAGQYRKQILIERYGTDIQYVGVVPTSIHSRPRTPPSAPGKSGLPSVSGRMAAPLKIPSC